MKKQSSCIARANSQKPKKSFSNAYVPPPGINISADIRAELLGGAEKLSTEIENLRKDFQGKSNTLALLPDIQIFEKAVRWAVQYNEIFASNEIASARMLVKQGMERV